MQTSQTILDILGFRAENEPDKIAFIFLKEGDDEKEVLTYKELVSNSKAIASHLQEVCSESDRAILFYPPGIEYIKAFFGCLYGGLIPIPAYPPKKNKPNPRIQSIIANANPQIILTTKVIREEINKNNQDIFLKGIKSIVTEELDFEKIEEWKNPGINPATIAFLQYTSGSTGDPKGVMVTHQNLMANQKLLRDAFQNSSEAVCVGWLPLYHDMGLIGHIIQPVYCGFTSILMSPVSFLQKPIRWLKAISDYKATISGAPNFAYQLCADKITKEELQQLDLSSWKLAYIGAEPIRGNTLGIFGEKFSKAGFNKNSFLPCYGLAESTLFVSGKFEPNNSFKELEIRSNGQGHPEEADKSKVSCGAIGGDQQVIIVNADTKLRLSDGLEGEVWISSKSVSPGYWNNEEKTKEVFKAFLADTGEGPFLRTGDLGVVKAGELYITGRLKDLIIIRGRNIYPQDIEHTVESSCSGLVKNGGAAFSLQKNGEEQLIVIQEVERTSINNIDYDQVTELIKVAIANEYQIQVNTVLLLPPGSVPKTSSGKIQRDQSKNMFLKKEFRVLAEWMQGKSNGTANIKLSNLNVKSEMDITNFLVSSISKLLHIKPETININEPFDSFGLDSLAAVEISSELEKWLGKAVSPTVVYDYPDIYSLVKYLSGSSTNTLEHKSNVYQHKEEAIAIIGIGCKFPGAENTDEFWKLILNGKTAVKRTGENESRSAIDKNSKVYRGGYIDKIDEFDPAFFGISPREAVQMDPQQRIIMEVCWAALEDACIPPVQLNGKQVGVFIGASSNDYLRTYIEVNSDSDVFVSTGNALSIISNRISYFFNLKGPSITVDTACSSSLVAVHQACQSLLQNESQVAIAGGVNLILDRKLDDVFFNAGMLSKEGECKTFDATADGYVRGEGCGVVVLKRLSHALKDGDPIKAIIRGSAINQDGRSNGLTAPNGPSQQAVIKKALEHAHILPSEISYVEAHGTGTPLGDPIEVNSIKKVMEKGRLSDNLCYIGSVKANIGHLEAAAGIAGLIKMTLVLQNKVTPPQVNYYSLNPEIQLENTPFCISKDKIQWSENRKRVAGVSSFGFGGTNAHIILEEAPEVLPELQHDSNPLHILTFTAKSKESLQLLSDRYCSYLRESLHTIEDISWSSNTCRSHFDYRIAIVTNSQENAIESLTAFSAEEARENLFYGKISYSSTPKIAFLFAGQATQYISMGKKLFETQPVFKETFSYCDDILKRYLDVSIIELLYAVNRDESKLDETLYLQPILFTYEYALAKLWMSWGIEPEFVLGHSFGEFVAACIAGVFSVEDGLRLVTERGRLMQELSKKGVTAAVFTGKETIQKLLVDFPNVFIAAINGPGNTVISGDEESVKQLIKNIKDKNIGSRVLSSSLAFHSPYMQPVLEEFETVLKAIKFSPPQLKVISNVTGEVISDEITKPAYWIDHIIKPVQFYKSIQFLNNAGCTVFLEIGPKPALSSLGRECIVSKDKPTVWVSSITSQENDLFSLYQAVCNLYVKGVDANWIEFYKNSKNKKVSLPLYPFNNKSYWPEGNQKNYNQHPYTNTHKEIMEPYKELPSLISSSDIQEKMPGNESIVNFIVSIVANYLQIPNEEVNMSKPFLEMGADSIILMKVIQKIEAEFDIELSVSQIFGEINTVEKVANYIFDRSKTKVKFRAEKLHKDELTTTHTPSLQLSQKGSANLFHNPETDLLAQVKAIRENLFKQLEVLDKSEELFSKNIRIGRPQAKRPTIAFKKAKLTEDRVLTEEQEAFLSSFIYRYNTKTKSSKEYAQKNRAVLCDWLNSINFRLAIKEIQYPIVSSNSVGSKIKDIDGNEYIDLAIGFGVNFFGNNPPFIKEAVKEQLENGFELATQTPLAGEVAGLISELTGAERVTFCNTGSDAVMTSLRIARAKTGRDKIVIFTGYYHGTFDGNLAQIDFENKTYSAIPIAPGTPQSLVDDVIVLTYGSNTSLEIINERSSEIAAVIIEPVQSRKPGFFPKAFLLELRKQTKKLGIALIFDEVITGFRAHMGGVQALLNIKADIVTYGKIIGGGMPIGIVAGSAEFLDTIDGGWWTYGDQSYPQTQMTFFGGTFCKHPLALAAAKAALIKMKKEGPALQEQVNNKTKRFAHTLNSFFLSKSIPIKVEYFASLFRFEFLDSFNPLLEPIEIELFFYMLIEKGVYTWERRICFFSTAHTDEDIDFVISQIEKVSNELVERGFFKEANTNSPELIESIKPAPKQEYYEISTSQQMQWLHSQIEEANKAYNTCGVYLLNDHADLTALEAAFTALLKRHEIFRTTFLLVEGEVKQKVNDLQELNFSILNIDISTVDDKDEKVKEIALKESQFVFDLEKGPLIRVSFVRLAENSTVLIFSIHHIIFDGWSVEVMIKDLIFFYNTYHLGLKNQLNPLSIQYKDYCVWKNKLINSSKLNKYKQYWHNKLSGDLPLLSLPTDYPRPEKRSYSGAKHLFEFSKTESASIRAYCHKNEFTPFMFFLATVNVLLYHYSGEEDIIIGSPSTGRSLKSLEDQLGDFLNYLVLRTQVTKKETFREILDKVKKDTIKAFENQIYPYDKLVEELWKDKPLNRNPFYDVVVVLAPSRDIEELGEEIDFHNGTSKFDLSFFINNRPQISILIEYSTELFKLETILRIEQHLRSIINQVLHNDGLSIDELIKELFNEKEKMVFNIIESSSIDSIAEDF